MRRIAVFSAAAMMLAAPLAAQEPGSGRSDAELVDRVVAVVGDTVLLLSDVHAELQQLEASGRSVPSDPVGRERVAREILDARVNDLVLLEAARDAGVTVSDEEVERMVEQDLQSVRRRFNDSDVAFREALAQSGLTLDQYRQQLREQYRNRQLIESFVGLRLRNRAAPLISEEQVRAAFRAQRESLGTRPATVSLRQAVVTPEPSDAALAEARGRAEEVLRELADGGDFEVLARRFSDDPGSKEHGGDLGWFKAGRMVPEFERAAFRLRPGQTSGIVRTDFGFHIIRVDRVRGPERKARHILIRPELTEADRQRARERADSLVAAVRGGANILALAREHGTPPDEVEVTRIPLDRLPPAYEEALRGAGAGDVVGPVELEGPAGSQWAVVSVVERQESGPYTLEDVRDQLLEQLQQREMIEQLVADLRRGMYVSIVG